MRRFFFAGLFGAVALLFAQPVRAQNAAPLSLVPADAEFVVSLERPYELAQSIYGHELLQEFLALDAVKSFYDSTTFRRLNQLLAFAEKKLGRGAKEAFEQLTAGGIVVTGRISKTPGALLIIQGQDAALLKNLFHLAVDMVNQELERQELKERVKKGEYRGCPGGNIGGKFHFIVVGDAFLVSTERDLLKTAVEQLLDKKSVAPGKAHAGLRDARAALPKNSHLVGWLDVGAVRKIPGFQDGFDALRLNPFFQITSGAILDVMHRTSAVYLGLAREGKDYRFRVAMPSGRTGMTPTGQVFVPADRQGTLPALTPPRVLLCSTEHLDFAQLWNKRKEIFNAEGLKGIEDLEKNSGLVLFGNKFSNLMQQAGRHYRIVIAGQDKYPYKIKPATPLPAFGLVLEMRDPAFAKTMNAVVRAGALLGGTQVGGLKMTEQEYKGRQIVSYAFNEDGKLEGDVDNLRFNFNPCFVTVGEHFVLSSTIDLGKDLVDLLEKEHKPVMSKASSRTFIYATGLAHGLKATEDDLLTQTILSQGLPPAAARKQIGLLTKLVERLGALQTEFVYEANDFRFDLVWRLSPPNCCDED